MANIAFLTGAIIGTFLLSRIFWLIAWKWPNSMTKAVVLNVVSALVIVPADYLAAIHAGNPANLLNGALLYGGCQFLVFLVDLFRVRRERAVPVLRGLATYNSRCSASWPLPPGGEVEDCHQLAA